MEKENLTKLTKGILQIKSSMPVPVLRYVIYDSDTVVNEHQYKICRYVGTSCRVIGTCYNYDEAVEKLNYWRDWYKTNEFFLVRVCIKVQKMSI